MQKQPKVKPTAGPLELHQGVDYMEVRQMNGPRVLYQRRHPDAEDIATAHLFMAASKMAESLNMMLIWAKTHESRFGQMDRRAIALAEEALRWSRGE